LEKLQRAKQKKENGKRQAKTQPKEKEEKKIQTRFSSRSLKNCNFFFFLFPLVAHRASSKKGIKNEISASRAVKKKKKSSFAAENGMM
jgi:hypothetical protein